MQIMIDKCLSDLSHGLRYGINYKIVSSSIKKRFNMHVVVALMYQILDLG